MQSCNVSFTGKELPAPENSQFICDGNELAPHNANCVRYFWGRQCMQEQVDELERIYKEFFRYMNLNSVYQFINKVGEAAKNGELPYTTQCYKNSK